MSTKKQNASKQLPAPTDSGDFRRANEMAAIRVAKGGTLTLLSRKVFNVMLYHTQRLGEPGADAPTNDPAYQSLYWVPLTNFTQDAHFNSEDVQALRNALDNLQSIKMCVDNSTTLGSDVLLSSYRIVNPLGKRGSRCFIGWEFPASIKQRAKDPDFYAWHSIYYLTMLRTTAGLALYEIAKRYLTSPGAVTRREPWEWWYESLTGTPISTQVPEYKYFKRDTVKPAVAEINSLTDIQVELIEHKDGRRIAAIQFSVTRKSQEPLELPAPPVIDSKTVARIVAFGIPEKVAEDVFASHDEGLIKATLALVEDRLANTQLPPLESPAAFFRSALRGRYAEAPQSKAKAPRLASKPARVPSGQPDEPSDPALTEARKQALENFQLKPKAEQDAILEAFAVANPALRAGVKKNPTGKTVLTALSGWLLKQSATSG